MSKDTLPNKINHNTYFKDWLTTINSIITEEAYIYDILDTKAPINHASTSTKYGVGNTTKYGHLKLSDMDNNAINYSEYDLNSGIAITPKALTTAIDNVNNLIEYSISAIYSTLANSYAPTNHASTSTKYGVGNATKYGHLKLVSDFSGNVSYSESDSIATSAYSFQQFKTEIENNPIFSQKILYFNTNIAISGTYKDISTFIYNGTSSNIITVNLGGLNASTELPENYTFTIKNITTKYIKITPNTNYTLDNSNTPIYLGFNDSITIKYTTNTEKKFYIISKNIKTTQIKNTGSNITISMYEDNSNYYEINSASCNITFTLINSTTSSISDTVNNYAEKIIVLKATVNTIITYPSNLIWMNLAQKPNWGNKNEILILKLIQVANTVYATALHNSQLPKNLDNDVVQQ